LPSPPAAFPKGEGSGSPRCIPVGEEPGMRKMAQRTRQFDKPPFCGLTILILRSSQNKTSRLRCQRRASGPKCAYSRLPRASPLCYDRASRRPRCCKHRGAFPFGMADRKYKRNRTNGQPRDGVGYRSRTVECPCACYTMTPPDWRGHLGTKSSVPSMPLRIIPSACRLR